VPALAIALVLKMMRKRAQVTHSSGVVRLSVCGAEPPAGSSYAFLEPQGLLMPLAVLAVPVVALALS
jgi:hypothetical protein